MEKNEKFATPIPDEKIEQVTGGGHKDGDVVVGGDGKQYSGYRSDFKRSCHLYKCKYCFCDGTGNHKSYCRSSENYRDACMTCSYGDSVDHYFVACRARPADVGETYWD